MYVDRCYTAILVAVVAWDPGSGTPKSECGKDDDNDDVVAEGH